MQAKTYKKSDKIREAYDFLKLLGKAYNGVLLNDSVEEILKDERLIQEAETLKKEGYAISATWNFGETLINYILPQIKLCYKELKNCEDKEYIKNLKELIWYFAERQKDHNLKLPIEKKHTYLYLRNEEYHKRCENAEKLLPLILGLWW